MTDAVTASIIGGCFGLGVKLFDLSPMGTLSSVNTITLLTSIRDIALSPDGKFLYVSNRCDLNSITIFSIDPSDGKLTLKGYQPTLGKGPRSFIIDPTGAFLLVAHQYTNDVIIFKRNKKSGLLTKTKDEIHLPIPVCLQLLKR